MQECCRREEKCSPDACIGGGEVIGGVLVGLLFAMAGLTSCDSWQATRAPVIDANRALVRAQREVRDKLRSPEGVKHFV